MPVRPAIVDSAEVVSDEKVAIRDRQRVVRQLPPKVSGECRFAGRVVGELQLAIRCERSAIKATIRTIGYALPLREPLPHWPPNVSQFPRESGTRLVVHTAPSRAIRVVARSHVPNDRP